MVGSDGGGGGGFRWGLLMWGVGSDGESNQRGEGSRGANVRGVEVEHRDKRWGGGELNGIFLQFEFRF